VSSVERLSAEDRLILWPDEVWPQDIGALGVLDTTNLVDSDGRFRIEAATQAIEGRLHLLPRFRQVLYIPGRGLGGPLWVDAPALNLSDHVHVEELHPRPTRRSCCGRSRGCDGAAWTCHGHCGRCGSSRGLLITVLAGLCGYTTSSRTASQGWRNSLPYWMQRQARRRYRYRRGFPSRGHRHVFCSLTTCGATLRGSGAPWEGLDIP
jgi:hypothetical protein